MLCLAQQQQNTQCSPTSRVGRVKGRQTLHQLKVKHIKAGQKLGSGEIMAKYCKKHGKAC